MSHSKRETLKKISLKPRVNCTKCELVKRMLSNKIISNMFKGSDHNFQSYSILFIEFLLSLLREKKNKNLLIFAFDKLLKQFINFFPFNCKKFAGMMSNSSK